MWRSFAGLLLLAFLPLAAQTQDDAAVRGLVQRYMDARNHKDVDATRKLFANDADQLVSTGEWRRGIDALVRGMAASSQRETGTSTIAIESVRFVTPEVAIVDGRYETTAQAGTTRKMWTTIVANRTGDGWRIAAIRNMLPSPAVH